MWAETALRGSIADGESELRLPTGTVTFLLTDIEGSTRLWSEFPEAMPAAVAQVYGILDQAVAGHNGMRPVEQGEGDSVVAAFSRGSDTVGARCSRMRLTTSSPSTCRRGLNWSTAGSIASGTSAARSASSRSRTRSSRP